MPYLLILRIKTAYNMHLKIVLHIKIQFVSSDSMAVNNAHLKSHTRNGHSRLPSATLWSVDPTAGMKFTTLIDISLHDSCEVHLCKV